MNRILLLTALLLLHTGRLLHAQEDSLSGNLYHAAATIYGTGTSGHTVPLWMRANRYGNMPEEGVSGSLEAAVSKSYSDPEAHRLLDWGFGFDGRLNTGNRTRFILVEGYAKARLSIFQLKAGRSCDRTGLVDSSLSSGGFAVSGNALGIPKVEISIPEFWTVPFTKGWVAVKGNYAHGWIGNLPLNDTYSYVLKSRAYSYFHQKSFYMSLGKPGWKIKLFGGFNHQVVWGDENGYFKDWGLSTASTYLKVITGGVNKQSKVGNHLGSLDMALEYDMKRVLLRGYHQFFYDVGGLYHLSNIEDGLWGLTIQNKAPGSNAWGWRRILVEFLYSKNQGGGLHAKITPSGDEDYYNNYIYLTGWTYKGENLGNPLFTNKNYARKGLPVREEDYFVNNRVVALHTGMEGYCDAWSFKVLLTYSRNYGTYGASPAGKSTGSRRDIGPPPYFSEVSQFNSYLEASRPLKKGYSIGFALAADYGDLLYNSVGGIVKLSKTF